MNLELLIPIFGIVGVFGMPLGITIAFYYFDSKNKDKFHSTLQKLIESRQELSPELLQSIPGYKKENDESNDIRTGVITAAVGIGITLFGQFGVSRTEVVGIGLMLLVIGLAMLGYGIYNKDKKVNDVS